MCSHCALSLCACIVRFIVRASGLVRQHPVHNGAPPFLHNEAAQCKTMVCPAWHNGRAYIGEAKSAWHNDFVIVRFLFDSFILLIQYSPTMLYSKTSRMFGRICLDVLFFSRDFDDA